jgi:hypothetical protein
MAILPGIAITSYLVQFAEHCEENSAVHSCTPNPVTSGHAISLDKVWYPEEHTEDVDDG